MVVKVLPPTRRGLYAGSARPLVNYLLHEGRSGEALFFSPQADGLTPDLVQRELDAGQRGLARHRPRFYSLVIAPSPAELAQMQKQSGAERTLTELVMAQYAAAFRPLAGKACDPQDVQWYALVHRTRRSRPEAATDQTHVHVLVAARDRRQSRTLDPVRGSRYFDYTAWRQACEQAFDAWFGFERCRWQDSPQQRLEKRLQKWQEAGLILNRERVQALARQQQYDDAFWKRLKAVERSLGRNPWLSPSQAYRQLEEGAPAPGSSRLQRPGRAVPGPLRAQLPAGLDTPPVDTFRSSEKQDPLLGSLSRIKR